MIKPHPRVQTSPHLQEAYACERAFLERARSGEDVRNEVVLHMQRPLYSLARRIHWRYSQEQGNVIEVSDLVHSASVEILATFPKALTKDEPFPYLFRLAYFTMLDCINGRGRLIKAPPEHKDITILSLDQPLAPDGTRLADTLPAERSSRARRLPLRQAIEALPERQKMVIQRYFGLAGNMPESFRQMSRALSPNSRQPQPNKVYRHYKTALATLRQQLSETFPHYATAGGAQ
jgi:DNA-directed RNA polymerase specialized sigma24 family protein